MSNYHNCPRCGALCQCDTTACSHSCTVIVSVHSTHPPLGVDVITDYRAAKNAEIKALRIAANKLLKECDFANNCGELSGLINLKTMDKVRTLLGDPHSS
jgi:hypothetical protein